MGFSLSGAIKGVVGGGLLGGPIGGQLGGLIGSGGLGGMFDGGPSTVNTSSSSRSAPNEYTLPAYNQFLGGAQSYYNQAPGATVAGFNPNQNQAFDMIQQNASGGNPLLNAADRTMTDTAAGNYLDPKTNPYLQGTIDQALGAVRGSLGSTFSGQGFGGSAHEQLLNQQSTQAAMAPLLQNYQFERGNQMNAVNNAQQYAATPANNLLGVGNQQQAYQQQLADEQAKKLGLLQSAVGTGISGGLNVDTTGVQPNQNQGSTLGNILGTVATGAGIYSLLSDIRLKKNIKRIGTHALGIGIYIFEYLWGEKAIGVMAQELLKVKPEAVHIHPSGYLMVRYDLL